MNFKKIDSCRINHTNDLHKVLDLGNHYMSGIFPNDLSKTITKGPLELFLSESSGLLQLGHNYDLDEMYGDTYGYRSGLNSSMISHLRDKANFLASIAKADRPQMAVLDIGSNDGTLLNMFGSSYNRIGVDPSSLKYSQYYDQAIYRYPSFFNSTLASQLLDVHGRFDIISSIAMFYDLEDPHDFVSGISSILSPDGIWHFEQSYLPSMIQLNSYDTICHEHLEYYSLEVVENLLAQHNLKVLTVELNTINGGSFAITACHHDSNLRPDSDAINCLRAYESSFKLRDYSTYAKFFNRIESAKRSLRQLVTELRDKGKTIYGYGASTKGNTILQYCQLSRQDIPLIVDVNPDKFGHYTPGTNIPIVSELNVQDSPPDYFLVLPWHFKDNILARETRYKSQGGKFIFPLPAIDIV